jgi:iron(III) transport system ATP-binding protein
MARVHPSQNGSDAAVPGVAIAGADKTLGGRLVLSDVTLEVEPCEFVAILGPSGCGKTTLLRLIAGFETLDRGTIALGGRPVSGPALHVPPERRNIGIVFQSFALWPHMTVAENVGYSLRVARVPRVERETRIADALAKVDLVGLHDRRPAQLSGGQRQRVALARCLVARPDVILLDEPLANLDVHLRAAMEEEFARFHATAGATTLYVTHDQAEAMALADRVAVIQDGRLIQFAEPEVLYAEPADAFVAGFVGEGRVLEVADVRPDGKGHARAILAGVPVRLRAAADERARPRARVCLRARDLRFAAPGESGIPATVVHSVYRGGFWEVEARFAAAPETPVVLNAERHDDRAAGSAVTLRLADGWVIPESHPAADESHPFSQPATLVNKEMSHAY